MADSNYLTYASGPTEDDWDMFISDDVSLGRVGGFAMAAGAKAIGQNIKERLQLFLEEWEYDLRQGTGWFQVIYIRPFNIANAESELKTRVLTTPGVIKLLEWSINYDKANRTIGGVACKVMTVEGEVEVTV